MSAGRRDPAVRVFPTAALADEAAVEWFVRVAAEAIRLRGLFVVALAGGSTPKGMYGRLAREPDVSRVEWSRVHVLWSDERCVPPEDAASNFAMAHAALLRHVPIRPINIHRARGEAEPIVAAREYEATIRSIGGVGRSEDTMRTTIDAVILGLGEDGHTASLFPGRTTIHESARLVETDVAPDGSRSRITLTPLAINGAAEIAFLVSGTAKAAIVEAVLEGPRRTRELPAQLIRPVEGHVTWFLDAAAASRLQDSSLR